VDSNCHWFSLFVERDFETQSFFFFFFVCLHAQGLVVLPLFLFFFGGRIERKKIFFASLFYTSCCAQTNGMPLVGVFLALIFICDLIHRTKRSFFLRRF